MRLSREGGGVNAINFANFGLRTVQFLVGLAVLIMYATQSSYRQWNLMRDFIQFSLGIAAGALALATTPVLALVPFFLGYGVVAWAFVWDLCVMAVYAGTFAYYKRRFPYDWSAAIVREVYRPYKISGDRVDVMRAAVILDLVGMLLWLITLLFAVGILISGRVRGSRKGGY